MNNTNLKVNTHYSLEVLKEIIKYMNDTVFEIEIIQNEIKNLEKNNVWVSKSSSAFSSKCGFIMKDFLNECESTNNLIRNMIKQINTYEQIDKNVLESLYGNMKI